MATLLCGIRSVASEKVLTARAPVLRSRLAAAAWLLFLCNSTGGGGAMAAVQPHARIVDVDGQELVYRQWGAASAQPLVYWPGLTPFSALELIEAGLWGKEIRVRSGRRVGDPGRAGSDCASC
jgi:hypothetical protein